MKSRRCSFMFEDTTDADFETALLKAAHGLAAWWADQQMLAAAK
jgi:hypothetical protein